MLILLLDGLSDFSLVVDLALKQLFDMLNLVKVESKSFLLEPVFVEGDCLFEMGDLVMEFISLFLELL